MFHERLALFAAIALSGTMLLTACEGGGNSAAAPCPVGVPAVAGGSGTGRPDLTGGPARQHNAPSLTGDFRSGAGCTGTAETVTGDVAGRSVTGSDDGISRVHPG